MNDQNSQFLFVYGTLKKGQSAHQLLEPRARFVCSGLMRGRLYDLGPYPVAQKASGPGQEFAGELYELNDPSALLDALDRYEGAGEHAAGERGYFRSRADVLGCDRRTYRAWVYLYAGGVDQSRRIGEWDPSAIAPQNNILKT